MTTTFGCFTGLLQLRTLSNPASAPGTGEVTYSSSDPSIATVDGAGLVTALAVGAVEIRAGKAADETYLAARASHTLNVAEESVVFSAWVGASQTQVSFPAKAVGMEFYRSSEPDCDLANYASCVGGQMPPASAGAPATGLWLSKTNCG